MWIVEIEPIFPQRLQFCYNRGEHNYVKSGKFFVNYKRKVCKIKNVRHKNGMRCKNKHAGISREPYEQLETCAILFF